MLRRFVSFLCGLAILVGCGSEHKNPAGLVQPEEPAGKLVVTKTKAGGKAERQEAMVIKNTAMADASPANPTAVLGAINVRIASFAIRLPKGAQLNVIGLSSQMGRKRQPDGSRFDLGDVFQNLRLVDAASGEPIGQIIGTLGAPEVPADLTGYGLAGNFDYGEPIYTFQPTADYHAADTIVVDALVDIKASVSSEAMDVVNGLRNGVVIPVVAYTDRNGHVQRMWARRGMQRVYIAPVGNLLVLAVPASSQVPSKIVTAGSTDEELFKFKLEASLKDEDAMRFIINYQVVAEEYGAPTDNGKPFSTLYNFKLYDGSTQVGPVTNINIVGNMSEGRGYLDFNLGSASAYRITRGEKIFTLKAMVNDAQSISSGSTHRFSLTGDAFGDGSNQRAITARGVTTALTSYGPEPGSEVVGNEITVRASYPLVGYLPLPSNTLVAGSTSQKTIAKLRVTAIGGQVNLKKLTFNIAVSDLTPEFGLELRDFKLYRNGSLMGVTEYRIVPKNGRVPVIFPGNYGEEIVSGPGNDNVYELKADIVNAHTGASTESNSISITLLGDEDIAHPFTGDLVLSPTGEVSIDGHDYNFVWSDGHGWTNGYQVPSSLGRLPYPIPLDSWRLSK